MKCLQVIVRSVDAKTLAKSLPEFIRTSMLTFFNNAAVDLEMCIHCLQEVRRLGGALGNSVLLCRLYTMSPFLRLEWQVCDTKISIILGKNIYKSLRRVFYIGIYPTQGKYAYIRGTHLKTSASLNYVQTVLLPVLTSLFDHTAACEFGQDLLCE